MGKIKSSRSASFALIGIVYILAAVAGIAVYNALPYNMWVNLLLADVAATIVTFIFSIIFGNASVYDPYWSVQPIVIIFAFCFGTKLNLLRALLVLVITIWGIRLTANWAYTFKNLMHQDWRYTMLREKTGAIYPIINFLGIHMVPTLIVYACTIPALYAFMHDGKMNAASALFLLVSFTATVIQGTADLQMHRFRKLGKGSFIRSGLWKYSRHPNYLGEILMWWGVALSVTSVFTNAWYLSIGAALNTVLFFTVSIPMADKRQSRKAGFEEYKEDTRMLLPIKKHIKR